MADDTHLYGLMAEFTSSDALVSAAERVHQEGYTRIDALTPMPVHGLAEAMGYDDRRIQKFILCGGLAGTLFGLGLQLHVNLIGWNLNLGGVYLSGYPLNIGGRPLVSLPSFIVPAFETTILFAAITAVVGTLALCGFPQPYHPVFNVDRFSMASSDKFFLVIESSDPKFGEATGFLQGAGAKGVYDVAE